LIARFGAIAASPDYIGTARNRRRPSLVVAGRSRNVQPFETQAIYRKL